VDSMPKRVRFCELLSPPDSVHPLLQTSPAHRLFCSIEAPYDFQSSCEKRATPETSAEPLDQIICTSPPIYAGNNDLWKGDFNGRTVAVKSLRICDGSRDLKRQDDILRREAVLWRQLSHPNLVPLLGLSDLGEGALSALVSPWLENGNIKQYLRISSEHVNRLQLMVSIAEGLSYLHSHKIVHGDIKPANLLIDQNGQACLSDFGLSKVLDGGCRGTAAGNIGSARYQAPELVLGEVRHATEACDIYSFALVCYEILSGIQPFANLQTGVDIVLAHYEKAEPFSNANKRLLESASADQEFWGLMSSSWDWFPYNRLKMNAVREALAAIEERSGTPLRQTHL